MQYIFLLTLLFSVSYSDVFSMTSFEADFAQTVINEKGGKLKYNGSIKAMKPHYALWQYIQPSLKLIYVNKNKVTIVEPELEQAIVEKLQSGIDFFNIIKNAKKIDKDTYITNFQSVKYTIYTKNSNLKSIKYKDQLDNTILINFTEPITNKDIKLSDFEPKIPLEYDIIKG